MDGDTVRVFTQLSPRNASTAELVQKEEMSQISTTGTVYFPLGTRVEKMTAMVF